MDESIYQLDITFRETGKKHHTTETISRMNLVSACFDAAEVISRMAGIGERPREVSIIPISVDAQQLLWVMAIFIRVDVEEIIVESKSNNSFYDDALKSQDFGNSSIYDSSDDEVPLDPNDMGLRDSLSYEIDYMVYAFKKRDGETEAELLLRVNSCVLQHDWIQMINTRISCGVPSSFLTSNEASLLVSIAIFNSEIGIPRGVDETSDLWDKSVEEKLREAYDLVTSMLVTLRRKGEDQITKAYMSKIDLN